MTEEKIVKKYAICANVFAIWWGGYMPSFLQQGLNGF